MYDQYIQTRTYEHKWKKAWKHIKIHSSRDENINGELIKQAYYGFRKES